MRMRSKASAPSAWAPDPFPRWILLFSAFMIAFSLLSVGLIRITGNGPDQLAQRVVQERALVFLDTADGAVWVQDGDSGATLTHLYGEQGFVRGALRALSRERLARGLGPEAPFRLQAKADGALTLLDPSTQKRIDLEAFGPSNVAQFAQFLSMPAQ